MAKSLASSIKILPVVKSAGGFVSKALKTGFTSVQRKALTTFLDLSQSMMLSWHRSRAASGKQRRGRCRRATHA